MMNVIAKKLIVIAEEVMVVTEEYMTVYEEMVDSKETTHKKEHISKLRIRQWM